MAQEGPLFLCAPSNRFCTQLSLNRSCAGNLCDEVDKRPNCTACSVSAAAQSAMDRQDVLTYFRCLRLWNIIKEGADVHEQLVDIVDTPGQDPKKKAA